MYNFKEVDDYLAEYFNFFDINCISIMISHNGEVVYDHTKVSSDKKEYKICNSYTNFNVGEISQIYVGILLLKLIEDGIVSVDEKITDYIPEFYHKDVRIIDLLTDTTGLDLSGLKLLEQSKNAKDYLNKLYSEISSLKVNIGKYSPDFFFKYFVMCDLIEHITKESVNEYANEVFFPQLNLKRTAFSVENLTYNNAMMLCDMDNNFIDNTNSITNECVYTTTTELLKIGEIFSNYKSNQINNILSKSSFKYALLQSCYENDGVYISTPVFKTKGNVDRYNMFAELSSPKTYGEMSSTGCCLSIDVENNIVIAITSNSTKLGTNKFHLKRIINKIMSMID